MLLSFRKISLLLVLLALAGCNKKTSPISETRDSILAFGTFVEVTLINIPPEEKQAVLEKINQDLQYMHYAFHPWRPGPLGRTNQLLSAAGEFTANPSVIPLLIRARQLAEQSHGMFNPAIGKLMRLWGFHEEFPPEGPPPDAQAIQEILRTQPRMSDLHIDGIRISNTNPAVALDLGGIAKGYAVEHVLNTLRQMGVTDAIINTGGDLKVIGRHGDRPWHIGVRDPRGDGVIASLDAHDGEAVFTSGDYERYYEYEGRRYHHILDPTTGYPADSTRSVTVIHHDATLADAAATALFVAGPQRWLSVAKSMGVTQAMLIDNQGIVYLTPLMQKRIKFEKEIKDVRVVTLP